MSKLQNISRINRNQLDEGNYFESLIGVALSLQLIDTKLIEKIQFSTLKLLADKCRQYTGGSSSSVRTEVSEEILKSIVFTLGIWLKEYKDPENAIAELYKTDIADGYSIGLKRISLKIKSTRYFYRLTRNKMVQTNNYTYNLTVIGSIEDFFKLYNPEFFAHKIYIATDYPIVFQPEKYQGIEFIQQYLSALNCENRFCTVFDISNINKVLTLYAINYSDNIKDIVLNIFSVVLSMALACAASGDDISSLSLTDEGKQKIIYLYERDEFDKFFLLVLLSKIQNEFSFDKNAFEYTRKAINKCHEDIIRNILIFSDYYE